VAGDGGCQLGPLLMLMLVLTKTELGFSY